MKPILKIKDLFVTVNSNNILKGIDLVINPGEIHVIMGTNGAGKSTLASVIMGHPNYKVTKGEILYQGENLLKMKVDERARKGIFLAMQYPSEIEGITNVQFLKSAINIKDKDLRLVEFYEEFNNVAKQMDISNNYFDRFVNFGYSGGEKKKNEIMQMLMLKPKLVLLDEIDSGLDIDAIKLVGLNVTNYFNDNKDSALLIITHYPRILEYIKPNYVHILNDGKIIKTGDCQLANELEKEGYNQVLSQ